MIEINHLWGKVREANPLVHTISNLVSANDCANLLLAVGAAQSWRAPSKRWKTLPELVKQQF